MKKTKKAKKQEGTTKHVPMRTCVACREKRPKSEFIRIVNVKDEGVFVDPTGKARGRGANVCASMKCFEKAVKKNAIGLALKTKVNKDKLQELRKDFEQALGEKEFRKGEKRVVVRVDRETFERVVGE